MSSSDDRPAKATPKKKPTNQWYTVFGACEEQRHGYHVYSSSPRAAEKRAHIWHRNDDSRPLLVAAVLEGKHAAVDKGPCRLCISH